MKIIHITPFYLPHIGGIEYHVYNLTKNLSKYIDVEVYSSCIPNHSKKYEFINNKNKVYRFKKYAVFDPIIPDLYKRLCKLQDEKIIFHIHSDQFTNSFISSILIKLKRSKFIITFHGKKIGYNMFDRIFQKYFRTNFCRKIIGKKAEYIISTSRTGIKLYNQLGVNKNKLIFIGNGIDFNEIKRFEKEIKNNDNLMVYDDYILFSGRLNPQKGVVYLFKAIKKAIKYDKNIKLIVIGNGNLKNKLIKFSKKYSLQNNIKFLNFLNRSVLLNFYKNAKFLIMPSLYETMPITIIECLALGTPVIASNIDEIPYLIKNNYNGLLIPPRNPDAIFNAIKKLYYDDNLISFFGKNAKKSITKNFSWEFIAKKHLEIYNKVL